MWIVKDTSTVYNGDGLVLRDFDFVGTQIAVGTPGLNLSNLSFLQADLLQHSENILMNSSCCLQKKKRVSQEEESNEVDEEIRYHAIEVMRNAAQLGGFACGEGGPMSVASFPGVQGGPVHVVGGSFIGAAKYQFL